MPLKETRGLRAGIPWREFDVRIPKNAGGLGLNISNGITGAPWIVGFGTSTPEVQSAGLATGTTS